MVTTPDGVPMVQKTRSTHNRSSGGDMRISANIRPGRAFGFSDFSPRDVNVALLQGVSHRFGS